MGHAIDYMTFDRKMPRRRMLEAVENWAKENVDPYEHSEDGNIWNIDVYDGSLNGDRAWHEDTVYACRQDAMDAIERMDKGFYDDHAVLYYDVDSLKPTAVMKDIKRRQEETEKKRETLNADSHTWAGRKSKYVTCEQCGSKLNVDRPPRCAHALARCAGMTCVPKPFLTASMPMMRRSRNCAASMSRR